MIAALSGGLCAGLAVAPDPPPVEISRDEAHRLAVLELSDPAYRSAEPSLVQRGLDWVIDTISRLVERAAEAAPGGWLGILGLVTLLVVVVLFVRWRVGPVARTADPVFLVDPGMSAAEYRRRAEELAAAERFDLAVTERMRALVRAAQEGGRLDAQPGWTADEAAGILAATRPDAAARLLAAAWVFDEVRYGGRPADVAAYRTVAAADDVLAASPVP